MLDPFKVAVDHNLVVLTLATYVVGTLVLIAYFLLRTPLLQRAGMILACLALRAAVHRAGHALEHDGRVAAHEPLRIALALQRPGRADLHHLRFEVRSVADRRRRARHRAIAFGYATTWNEATCPPYRRCSRTGSRCTCRSSCRRTRRSWWRSSCRACICSRRMANGVSPTTGIGARERRGARRERRRCGRGTGRDVANVKHRAHRDAGHCGGRAKPAIRSRNGWPDCRRWRGSTCSLTASSPSVCRSSPSASSPALMWANEAWGAYWQWDSQRNRSARSRGSCTPRYMHLHTRNAWRGDAATGSASSASPS